MIKKIYKLSAISLFSLVALSGCGKSDDNKIVIRVLNAADYIYLADENAYYCENCGEYYEQDAVLDLNLETETGDCPHGICPECKDQDTYLDEDMMDQFVRYMNYKYKDEGKTFSYVYDTFDTPETCFNEMKTGKSHYDVINVSDYMLQKMITEDLIQPLFTSEYGEEIKDSLKENISPYLWGESDSIFDNISPKIKDSDEYDTSKRLSDYSVPYMWGTVGVMYNPSYYIEHHKDTELFKSKEEIIEAFKSWDNLYSEFTNQTFSIKDSVRDMYAVSTIHAHKDEINSLITTYGSNSNKFHEEFSKLFNRCDETTIELVKEDLMKLRDNSYGFEVDSGKTDMVDGKIGGNICWSGDATWAMVTAQVQQNKEIYFVTPEDGSNLWTDAWAVPTTAQNLNYSLDLIEFMSSSEIAAANMDYVGYTSATATEDTFNYFVNLCGADDDTEDEYTNEYDLSYFFKDRVEDTTITSYKLNAPGTFEYEDEDLGMVDVPVNLKTRMLESSFPREDLLPKLAVMDDYGKQNVAVLNMWEQVRTTKLPTWAIILLVIEILAILTFVGLFVYNKMNKAKLKKLRKK